jgi:hypothetical protein
MNWGGGIADVLAGTRIYQSATFGRHEITSFYAWQRMPNLPVGDAAKSPCNEQELKSYLYPSKI